MNDELAGDGPSPDRIDGLLALYRQGKLEETLDQAEQLLLQFPNVPFVLHLHGAANAGLGRLDEAVASYEEALSLAPDYARAHYSLGTVLDRLGRIQEAVSSYTKALQIKPDFAEAYSNLGIDLMVLGNPEAAVASYRKAIHFAPELAEAHNNLGYALDRLRQREEAAASFRRALEIDPAYADAHNNLGNTLVHLGRPEEAAASYAEALRIKPDFAEAHRNLSTVKEYREDDPQIALMLELMASEDLANRDRMHLCFALGKAHADFDSRAKAFSWYSDGNRLRKQDLGYDSASTREKLERVKARFRGAVPVLDADGGSGAGQRVTFVVGMPLSGTSFVEQTLTSHSQVFGAGATDLLGRSVRSIDDSTAELTLDDLRSIREAYRSGLSRLRATAPDIIDQMPFNFWRIGYILAALPEARVIHVQRDARATCWANFRHFFPDRTIGFSNDLRDLAEYYRMYADLMAFWHERFPGKIYDLSYEALTAQQETESRRLLEHVGLDWQEQCLPALPAERAADDWRGYRRHLEPMIEELEGY